MSGICRPTPGQRRGKFWYKILDDEVLESSPRLHYFDFQPDDQSRPLVPDIPYNIVAFVTRVLAHASTLLRLQLVYLLRGITADLQKIESAIPIRLVAQHAAVQPKDMFGVLVTLRDGLQSKPPLTVRTAGSKRTLSHYETIEQSNAWRSSYKAGDAPAIQQHFWSSNIVYCHDVDRLESLEDMNNWPIRRFAHQWNFPPVAGYKKRAYELPNLSSFRTSKSNQRHPTYSSLAALAERILFDFKRVTFSNPSHEIRPFDTVNIDDFLFPDCVPASKQAAVQEAVYTSVKKTTLSPDAPVADEDTDDDNFGDTINLDKDTSEQIAAGICNGVKSCALHRQCPFPPVADSPFCVHCHPTAVCLIITALQRKQQTSMFFLDLSLYRQSTSVQAPPQKNIKLVNAADQGIRALRNLIDQYAVCIVD